MSFFARVRRVLHLLADPRTPRMPRIVVMLAGLYLLSPIDLLPDWAPPIAGWVDDLVMLWLSLRWLVRSAPAEPAGLAPAYGPAPMPGSAPTPAPPEAESPRR